MNQTHMEQQVERYLADLGMPLGERLYGDEGDFLAEGLNGHKGKRPLFERGTELYTTPLCTLGFTYGMQASDLNLGTKRTQVDEIIGEDRFDIEYIVINMLYDDDAKILERELRRMDMPFSFQHRSPVARRIIFSCSPREEIYVVSNETQPVLTIDRDDPLVDEIETLLERFAPEKVQHYEKKPEVLETFLGYYMGQIKELADGN